MLWFFNRYDNDSQKRFEDEERVDLSNFWQLRTSLHGCGTSLISIINSVLDFAKLESEKQDYERIDLVKLLEVSEVCFVGQQMVSAIYNDNNKITNNNDEENLLMGNNNTADARWWVMAEDGALK
ncbi:22477_t:CDS:2 [Rhizophagus irregularis]|nr:22477_t:CDS:2 [Rhizophagus irregularis]